MATDEVPYRSTVPLAFELVQHVGIFFEENLCASPICETRLKLQRNATDIPIAPN
jgi:hypothetical protein